MRQVIAVRDLTMRLYVCIYIYIYIYPSQSTIVASIDCAIGKMVWPIRQSFLAQRKQVIEDFAAQTTS